MWAAPKAHVEGLDQNRARSLPQKNVGPAGGTGRVALSKRMLSGRQGYRGEGRVEGYLRGQDGHLTRAGRYSHRVPGVPDSRNDF